MAPVSEPAQTFPAPRRHVDPVLAVLGVLVLVVAVGYGADLGGRAAQVVVCWLLMAAVHLALVVVASRVARLPDGTVATRRMWAACSLAALLYLVGDLTQLVTVAGDPLAADSATGTSVQALFVAAGTAVLLVAMLRCPLGIDTRAERSRFRLDVATVLVAAATCGFYGIALPGPGAEPGWLLDLVSTLLTGPGLFLVGVFAVVKLIMGGQPPFTRAAGTWCGAAALLEGLVQTLPAWDLSSRTLALVLGGNVVASTLLVVSARTQQLRMRAQPGLFQRQLRPPYSVLPYAAIVVTYALLIYGLLTQGLTAHTWTVVGGALLSTALVVARQIAAFRHISELLAERDALGAQLAHQAFHDSLTGLANRALLAERLGAALAPGTDRQPAVLLIDLDDFKPVNDTYGHAAGDALLVQVGAWLTGCVRQEDTVARLGGDEFAVLLADARDETLAAVAARISAQLCRTARIGDVEVAVRASVGAAAGRPGTDTADELLRRADLAMYAVKRTSKTRAARPVQPVAEPVAAAR